MLMELVLKKFLYEASVWCRTLDMIWMSLFLHRSLQILESTDVTDVWCCRRFYFHVFVKFDAVWLGLSWFGTAWHVGVIALAASDDERCVVCSPQLPAARLQASAIAAFSRRLLAKDLWDPTIAMARLAFFILVANMVKHAESMRS